MNAIRLIVPDDVYPLDYNPARDGRLKDPRRNRLATPFNGSYLPDIDRCD